MRRILAITLLVTAMAVGPFMRSAPAGAQQWQGFYLTASGSMHCLLNGNYFICSKYGPGGSYYVQNVVERWLPSQCMAFRVTEGNNAGQPALIDFGAPGGVLGSHTHAGWNGCLPAYPQSTTQGFCAGQWLNSAEYGCIPGTLEGYNVFNTGFVTDQGIGFKHGPGLYYNADLVDRVAVY